MSNDKATKMELAIQQAKITGIADKEVLSVLYGKNPDASRDETGLIISPSTAMVRSVLTDLAGGQRCEWLYRSNKISSVLKAAAACATKSNLRFSRSGYNQAETVNPNVTGQQMAALFLSGNLFLDGLDGAGLSKSTVAISFKALSSGLVFQARVQSNFNHTTGDVLKDENLNAALWKDFSPDLFAVLGEDMIVALGSPVTRGIFANQPAVPGQDRTVPASTDDDGLFNNLSI